METTKGNTLLYTKNFDVYNVTINIKNIIAVLTKIKAHSFLLCLSNKEVSLHLVHAAAIVFKINGDQSN